MSVDSQDGRPYNPHKKLQLSCAECRRLKLKCSRSWPCTSCQKRGLSNLCPDGALATKPRTKQTQTVPQHVAEHIQQLQSRINQLEQSLASVAGDGAAPPVPPSLFAPQENDPNMPYLQKKLMQKMAMERAQNGEYPSGASTKSSDSEVEEVSASLGTLKIGPDGRSVFFGPTAVTEGLSIDDVSSAEESSDISKSQPPDILALAQCFPFTSASATITALQERAKSQLPPLTRARELCASYFAYATFVIDIVPEDEWFETLFRRLYGALRVEMRSPASSPDETIVDQQWHLVQGDELALFFCVLALGALTDLSSEPFNSEAEGYYNTSRALMTTEGILTEPTICSIQTLCLASYYEGLRSQKNSSRNCWAFMMLASKMAHIMGLHRDHSQGLDEREMLRRRLVFWEVHSMDMIQSLALGRPVCTPPNYMDTFMPVDKHARAEATGQAEESFYRWKYRFCAQVVTLIVDHVLRVRTPSYTATLEVDRQISQFSSTFGRTNIKHPTPLVAAQLQMMLGTRETCVMYIHRGFFAQAISMDPEQPEHGKYGRSVLRTFEGACIIIQGMHKFVSGHAKFAVRIWFLWNHVLTATFVMASIAIRATLCSLAATAFRQLDVVDQIIKQTAQFGGRPKFMQSIVQSLRQKAQNARIEARNGSPAQQTPSPGSSASVTEENDELAVIGGKTRVLVTRQSSSSPRTSRGSAASTPPASHGRPLDQTITNDPGHPSPKTSQREAQATSNVPPPSGHHSVAQYPSYSEYDSYQNSFPEYSQPPGNSQPTSMYPNYEAYGFQPQQSQIYSGSQYGYNGYNAMDSTNILETGDGYSQGGSMYQPMMLQSFNEDTYMSNQPQQPITDGGAHLWHALIQDLGVGTI